MLYLLGGTGPLLAVSRDASPATWHVLVEHFPAINQCLHLISKKNSQLRNCHLMIYTPLTLRWMPPKPALSAVGREVVQLPEMD